MNKKKLLTMLTAMGLVGVVAIGGTIAYLTAQTTQVTNTFTLGSYPDAALDIFEYQVTRDNTTEQFKSDYVIGSKIPGDITENGHTYTVSSTSNTDLDFSVADWESDNPEAGGTVEGIVYGDIIPGSEIPKAPTVSLNPESPNSRIYVKLEGAQVMMNEGAVVTFTNNWTQVEESNGVDGIYIYTGARNDKLTMADLTLENTSIITEAAIKDVNSGLIVTEPLFTTVKIASTQTNLDNVNKITVDAAAIQASNVETLGESLEAVKGLFDNK